jgi:hypothetical protein
MIGCRSVRYSASSGLLGNSRKPAAISWSCELAHVRREGTDGVATGELNGKPYRSDIDDRYEQHIGHRGQNLDRI